MHSHPNLIFLPWPQAEIANKITNDRIGTEVEEISEDLSVALELEGLLRN